MLNNLNILFFCSVFFSSVFSISSLSWFSMWMGLEINMISFIPLFLNTKNLLSNESSMKYFLIQALASSLFLFFSFNVSFFFFHFNEINLSLTHMFLMFTLALKLGAAPFHNWFITVIEGMEWNIILMFLSWQKMAPAFISFYLMNNSFFMIIFSSFSLIFGSLGGLNQTFLKKILSYSSISHLGWMYMSMFLNKYIFTLYFIFYSLMIMMTIFHLNNSMNNFNQIFSMSNQIYIAINLMSLGGAPPFLGFFPKWLVTQYYIHFNLWPPIMLMILSTLITLLFYLQMILSNCILFSTKQKWMIKNNMFLFVKMYSLFLTITSMSLFLFNINF